MRNIMVMLNIGFFFLFFVPSSTHAISEFGVEVGNTMSSQGSYIAEDAQVYNPGFEQGTDGWFMAKTSGTNCSFDVDPDAYEGLNAAKLIVTNDGYCMIGNSTSIPILRTETYTLKLYAKVFGDVNHLTIAVYKTSDPDANPNILVDYINPNVFSGDYELIQLPIYLNAGEYIRLELGIDNNASGTSYVLFDNVELFDPSAPPGDPIPDIKANGWDGPLSITPSESCNITISLDPGDFSGQWTDWRLGVMSPFGTIPFMDQPMPIFALSETTLLDIPLPTGIWIFYFIIDDNPDRIFDRITWYDYVVVVSSPE